MGARTTTSDGAVETAAAAQTSALYVVILRPMEHSQLALIQTYKATIQLATTARQQLEIPYNLGLLQTIGIFSLSPLEFLSETLDEASEASYTSKKQSLKNLRIFCKRSELH